MASELAFQDVPVEKVMTAAPATVEPDASLADAAEALLQGGFRHLPVVNAQGRPVGMVSERDVRASLGTDLHGFTDATVEALAEPVSGVMTPDPVAVPLGTRLGAVLDLFADERVGALLVVDEAEKLRGILSYVDLLLFLRDHPGRGREAPPPARRKASRRARPAAGGKRPASRTAKRARPGAGGRRRPPHRPGR